jgi:hypothetical protein
VAVAEEADGAGSPELDVGKAELLGGVDGEAHDDVGDDAGDGRVAEVREQAAEGPEAGLRGGLAQRGDVLRDVVVLRRRQAVGDGGEAEAREAGHGRRPAGPDEARLVVLGVDEGDVEAPGVQQLRHVEHRGDVALRWVRQAHGVRLLRLLLRGAAERTHGGDRRSACAVCVACRALGAAACCVTRRAALCSLQLVVSVTLMDGGWSAWPGLFIGVVRIFAINHVVMVVALANQVGARERDSVLQFG